MLQTTSKHVSESRSVPFLNLKKLIAPYQKEFDQAYQSVLQRGDYINGKDVKAFEQEFATWIGGNCNSVGCANGTDAIELAIEALNLPSGGEAILPAMTFFATAESVARTGLKIKLVDVIPGTGLMDLDQLKRAVSSKTKLIVPVHLFGQMVAMDEVRDIADSVGAKVLEDAAQAHGARWKEQPVGHFGDVATYSFYPGKNLGALGDAGAVLSRESSILERVRALGDHGGLVKYQHDLCGYNSRLDTLQAAFLRVKLKYIDGWNRCRREIADQYRELLSDLAYLSLPVEQKNATGVYHLFVVLVGNRERFRSFLQSHGVATGIHYPKAIHEQPALAAQFSGQSFPIAEQFARSGVSLPMCPTLETEEIDYVSQVIHRYYEVENDR